MQDNKEEINKKKQILCKAIGTVVYRLRQKQGKGINLFQGQDSSGSCKLLPIILPFYVRPT